jgi:hypothetical protein
MYYVSVLARMEHEERVKAFEARHEDEYPGLLSKVSEQTGRLFYALKYRLSASRKQAVQATENPCPEMQAVGQNGC